MCQLRFSLLAAFLALLQTSNGATEPSAVADRKPRTDRYGDPLPEEALSRLGTVRFRQGGQLTFVQFTPDGNRLISQGMDGVRTWNVATGQMIDSFPKDLTGALFSPTLALTPDCKRIAVASGLGIHLWDVANARSMRRFCTDSYEAVTFSPDGELLAAWPTLGEQVVLFETQTGRCRWTKRIHTHFLGCMGFTPDGKSLAVAPGRSGQYPPLSDHAILFLDVMTGKELRRFDLGTCAPSKMAFSPDGGLLGLIGQPKNRPGQIHVWELATARELTRIEAPVRSNPDVLGRFSALVFTPDCKSLLTTGDDDWISAWKLATGKEQRRIARGVADSSSLSIAPNGKTAAIAAGMLIRIIDLATGEDVIPVADPRATFYSLAVTPDSRHVTAPLEDSRWALWDLRTGRPSRYLRPGRNTTGVWFLPDGRTAWDMDWQPKILYSWDSATAQERSRVLLDFVGDMPFMKGCGGNGEIVAVIGNNDDTLHLVGLPQGRRLAAIKDEEFKSLAYVLFPPDGKTMLTMSWHWTAQFWDIATGKKLHRFGPIGDAVEQRRSNWSHSPGSYSAALSPDGKLLAYGSQEEFICLYDTETGRKVRKFDKLDSAAMQLAFSPDGCTLAWASENDPPVHVIELASGKERHVFTGHRGGILSLAFSPDGRVLVSGSVDTTALVWDFAGQLGSDGSRSCGLEPSWEALAGDDAGHAYDAIRTLVSVPRTAVAFIGDRVRPVQLPDEKLEARLFADLDSTEFATREKAHKSLFALGDAMEAQCRQILREHPSPEVRRRLEAFLDRQARDRSTPTRERLRTLRALEVLELIHTPQSQRLLESLAGGVADAMVTQVAKASLERLAKERRAAATRI
jgi:WD40 repeat protein